MDLKKLITEYLQQARLMQIATSKNNQPWACTVNFAFDENMNLYWISKPDTRHSQEISENEKIAGTIVLPHNPGDKPRGLQFQGVAHQAIGEELQKAMDVYAKRAEMTDERKQRIISGEDGHIPYIITPKLFVLFDTVNFPDNPRQEYQL